MLEIGIPIYNATDTLAKALDSLVAQTQNNFIVCLSIDGDGNLEIYKQIAQEYIHRGLKIRIIDSKENGGPGMARQRILDTTQCDYIMFLDSDDILMPRAVKLLYTQAKTGNYDVIRSSFIREEKNGQDKLIPYNIETITWFHGKIYRVAYLKEKKISFLPGLRVDEDAYFNLIAWNSATNRGEINEVTYVWRYNDHSITRIINVKDYFINTHLAYIRSQVEGLRTLIKINGELNSSLITQTLVNIYNYYMRAKHYNINEAPMINLISVLKNEKWMQEYLKQPSIWQEVINICKPGAVYENEIIFFDESFFNWAMRLLVDDRT